MNSRGIQVGQTSKSMINVKFYKLKHRILSWKDDLTTKYKEPNGLQ